MRKKIFLFIVSSLLLIGCNNNTTTSSSISFPSSIEDISSNSIVESSTASNENNTTSFNPSSSQISEITSSSSESNSLFVSSNIISSSDISSNVITSNFITSTSSTNSNSSISSSNSSFITSSESSSSLTSNSISSSSSSNSSVVSYDGYYSTISPSLSGEALQNELKSLISKNYHDLGYDGLLSAYRTTDCYPGTNIIWDMYSNEEFVCGGPKENKSYKKEGDGYNREHSVPQSYFGKKSPMKADLFHVYPTDGYVNNRRSSYPYGEVSSYSYKSGNGSKLGPSSFPGYSGKVFEPIDEYKGDFARSYFYFATRYPAKAVQTPDGAVTFSTSYPYLTNYAINLFTKWSEEDPISQKEIDRNEAVYKLQKNRNPFIDHPEFINKIFGGNTTTDKDVNKPVVPPEKTDQDYANEVVSLINNIGVVTASSGNSISKAEKAYNNLTDSQKVLVTNYQILLDAKEAFKEYQGQQGDSIVLPLNISDDSKKALVSGDYSFKCNINANGVDSDRGIQFTNSSILSSSDKKLLITSNDYTAQISQISIKCATNADPSKIAITVYVGEIQLSSSSNTLSTSELNDYIFTSSTTVVGEIRIEITSSVNNKSFYIDSISIN